MRGLPIEYEGAVLRAAEYC